MSATPEVGQVWDYVERQRGRAPSQWANDPLKIVRPGKRAGDWLAIRLCPGPGEAPGFEWPLTRQQIEDRCYRRRTDVEAKLAVARQGARREVTSPPTTEGQI